MNFLRPTVSLFAAVFALTACGIDQGEVTMEQDETGMTEDALTGARFETFTGKDGQYYFHLIAGNNEKVLSSEGYTTAYSAKNGISSVKTNGVSANRFLAREASDGRNYFVLTATNGQIIGVSQMYATPSAALAGQNSVISVVKAVVAQTAAPKEAKFETFRGLDSKYYFHVRAGNGEIVIQSQGYTTSSGANNGIASVQTNGAIAGRYTVLAAADGKYYFTLKAGNGAVIGRGETYASKYNAERGVAGCVALLSGPVAR